MPAILTHYAFAKDNYLYKKRYYPLMNLGAQGPDVFFFYGYSLAKNRTSKKLVRSFGTYLHQINLTDFFMETLDYASRQQKEEQDLYYSFIYGLFLHYILDRNVHPYVFYRTGFPSNEKEAFAYMYAHVFFETMMDCLVSQKLKIKKKNVKAIKNNKDDIKKISKMYYEVNLKLFNFSYLTPLSYYHAYKDMIFLEKLFTSPTGFKRTLYRMFFYKTQLYPQTNMRKVKYNDILDVLNEKKGEWKNPSSGEVHYESLFELFAIAKEEAKIIANLIEKHRSGEDIKKELKAFINDINHDGCLVGSKKQYMDYVYNKLPKRIVPFNIGN